MKREREMSIDRVCAIKGTVDFKNVDENRQILALLRAADGF
jgi:hypothetical protein